MSRQEDAIPDYFIEECAHDWKAVEPLRETDPSWPPFEKWVKILWHREQARIQRSIKRRVTQWHPPTP